ncbi:hypothetical protein [Pseudoalteromonas luteoviolacea]|uniref:Cytochrome-c oxidase n=1 Tax=Pseudoalteromonas luteoviolacea NCIMB 1942 TaxID=1365253 RepID=A0A166Y967_9GAMM|nr:hypothetical protein [Pseudoalteromonas luteoviolacea]KZN41578.1 hypothetical protein N482_20080 [Pseudoalteromonas luteoviolacea NCIMB 1942]
MNKLGIKFMVSAAFYGLIAMSVGVYMAATSDYLFKAAHGHLNLLGWVTMSIFGIVYFVLPDLASTKLAKLHFYCAHIAVLFLSGGMAIFVLFGSTNVAKVGAVFAISSMLLFLFGLIKYGSDNTSLPHASVIDSKLPISE